MGDVKVSKQTKAQAAAAAKASQPDGVHSFGFIGKRAKVQISENAGVEADGDAFESEDADMIGTASRTPKSGAGNGRPVAMEDETSEAILNASCPNQSCTGILDTGSNIIAGPTDAIKALTASLKIQPDCSNFHELAAIQLNIAGMPVTIQPEGYVMKVPMPNLPAGWDGNFDQKAKAHQAASLSEDVAVQVGAGHVKRHHAHGTATAQRWRDLFERINTDYGVDMRDQVDAALKANPTVVPEQMMCTAALVPLDKTTKYGPLWVLGTPLLQSYYARFSFPKPSCSPASPVIHLQLLKDAKVCGKADDQSVVSNQGKTKSGDKYGDDTLVLMRNGKAAAAKQVSGPALRLPEEIAYPHWAKSLLQV